MIHRLGWLTKSGIIYAQRSSIQAGFSFSVWRLTQSTEGCFRVYNDWPSEFCTTAPDRLLGVDLLPMKGPIEWAIEEVQRVAKKGLCSVRIPSWIMGRSFGDPSYSPLWATLQELGPADFLFTSARTEPKTDEAPVCILSASSGLRWRMTALGF